MKANPIDGKAMQRLLRTKQAAEYLCISGWKLRHIIQAGDLPIVKYGENAPWLIGTPGLLFHDLRRSAARNLRNQGTAEEVIMKIGGWRTASVFKRYSIVSQSDIADATGKLGAGQQQVAQEQAEQFGQGLGRVAAQSTDSRIALPLPTPLFN